MEYFDNLDHFDQYSSMYLKDKLYKLKLNNIQTFLETSLKKTYNLYKKNKNCNISFTAYQDQLLKNLEKQKKVKIPKNLENLNVDTKHILLLLLLL